MGECCLTQPESKIFLATPHGPQATVYAGQDRNLYAELRQLRVNPKLLGGGTPLAALTWAIASSKVMSSGYMV
jgi:hypothetical protein